MTITLEQAVNIVVRNDATTVSIWSAADQAGISAKELTEELHKRKIIDATAGEFVKKMSGKDWERVYRK